MHLSNLQQQTGTMYKACSQNEYITHASGLTKTYNAKSGQDVPMLNRRMSKYECTHNQTEDTNHYHTVQVGTRHLHYPKALQVGRK